MLRRKKARANISGKLVRMRMTFLVCLTILAAGCSGSGKPTDAPGDATTSAPLVTSTANATPSETTTAPTATPNKAPEVPPSSGVCGGRTCAAGETCVSYYGIAGARGPQFHDCVIPCRRGTANDGCPSGKRCTTISDGPGDVCQ